MRYEKAIQIIISLLVPSVFFMLTIAELGKHLPASIIDGQTLFSLFVFETMIYLSGYLGGKNLDK